MNYNIALIGFGGVNRALASIIATDPEKFYREMGFNLRIVAVSDMFLGSVYSPEGIDMALLTALPAAQGACANLPNGKATADNKNIINNWVHNRKNKKTKKEIQYYVTKRWHVNGRIDQPFRAMNENGEVIWEGERPFYMNTI